jgi:uncharacterized phiE125 gp8 family phage protein
MYPSTLDFDRVEAPLKMELVTPPEAEPVSYSDVADWLRLPSFDDRNLTLGLITVARRYIEEKTRRCMITQTWNQWQDFFTPTLILGKRPVQQVNYIQYTDQTGTLQTLDPSRYLLDNKGPRPGIIPPLGEFFPIARVQFPNAVCINFTAGYGAGPANVPMEFQACIKQWVHLNYDMRQGIVLGRTPAVIPHTFEALLNMCSLPEV